MFMKKAKLQAGILGTILFCFASLSNAADLTIEPLTFQLSGFKHCHSTSEEALISDCQEYQLVTIQVNVETVTIQSINFTNNCTNFSLEGFPIILHSGQSFTINPKIGCQITGIYYVTKEYGHWKLFWKK